MYLSIIPPPPHPLLYIAYNVEAGLQPNYNQNNAAAAAANAGSNAASNPNPNSASLTGSHSNSITNNSSNAGQQHIDNRAIIQPYSLGTGNKQPEYQFAADNRGYEPETNINGKQQQHQDVERVGAGGAGDGHDATVGKHSKAPLPPPTRPIVANFERAIELCDYGKFHYILLAICGLVSTSEEMDVISMSFILPSAQCDLDLNTETKGWLNSIIFIGMMVGAYFWGSIADSFGRKKILIVISFMNAFCIVASSFSQSYTYFMLFRFLNGAA